MRTRAVGTENPLDRSMKIKRASSHGTLVFLFTFFVGDAFDDSLKAPPHGGAPKVGPVFFCMRMRQPCPSKCVCNGSPEKENPFKGGHNLNFDSDGNFYFFEEFESLKPS